MKRAGHGPCAPPGKAPAARQVASSGKDGGGAAGRSRSGGERVRKARGGAEAAPGPVAGGCGGPPSGGPGQAAPPPCTPGRRGRSGKPGKRKRAGGSKQDHQIALEPVEEAFAAAEERERAERGWSLDEVAARAVVRRGTIQHVEHRRRGVSLRVAWRIAHAFDQELGAFLAQGRQDLSGADKGCPGPGDGLRGGGGRLLL